MRLKTTLEQWTTLREIEKAGSIQAAAAALNKSHTTLIYSVRKLEDQLGVPLLEVKGRKATLTVYGQGLLRRAATMLEQARDLELLSQQMSMGAESEIVVAMDHLCDPNLLYQPMSTFLTHNSMTSVQVIETSLSKTAEMVTKEQADIAIVTLPITNYPAEAFSLTAMIPVVSVAHPLAAKEMVTMSELAATSQIVVRDLGENNDTKSGQNVGWLKAQQRITVDNFDHAFRALEHDVGFCRLPEHILKKRNHGQLVRLNLEHNNQYHVPLHLVLPKGINTGPAAHQLYQVLLDVRFNK